MTSPTDQLLGLGTDLVEVDEIRSALTRQPGLRERLFTLDEWQYAERHRDPLPHLAARFAAKEATMKSLGRGMGAMAFTEIEVVKDEFGAPGLLLTGRARQRSEELGVTGWKLSITHTRSLAHAVVVALVDGAEARH